MSVLSRVAGLVLAAGLLFPAAVSGQTYPSKSVRIIVPFGAGGPADVYARIVAQHLSEAFKQNFVIEDRPGAGAIIGTDAVAKSAPDGYTLLVMSNTHTTNESLIPNKPFQLMRDFVPIAPINSSDLLMVAHPSTGVKNLKEFIALAKARPGELNYASSGPGTPYHMAAELFKAMTGTDIVHVPHKSSGDMRSSVIGGHVHMMFDAITVMAEGVRSGQLLALGTTGEKRSTVMPEVPTVAEAGVAGYEATIWIGLMAPAATPRPIIERLNAEVKRLIALSEVKDKLEALGFNSVANTPEEFAARIRTESARWAKVIRDANIRIE